MKIDPPPAAQQGEEEEKEEANGGTRRAVSDAVMMMAAESALQCASDHDLRVAYYCEENVWRLAYRKRHHQLYHDSAEDRFWVVFISNAIKNVPMFQQRASQDPRKSVCWDYHVILIGIRSSSSSASSAAATQHQHHDTGEDGSTGEGSMMMVYDIDSRIVPYPCPLQQYLQHSFPYEWPEPYNPMFRVIPADRFLSHFSSDRSHMINSQTGEWNAPPPPYTPIVGSSASNSGNNNLQHYLNFVGRPQRMEMEEDALGQIWSKQQFAATEFARD
jgi:protein N-terminal glutamine amidohydrolase